MKIPQITIIVCTYNRAEMLRKALGTLICQKTDGNFTYENLVVDDGSTDHTKDIVEEVARRSHVKVRYVREEGKGYTYAMNRGVKESHGEWMVFFDDDELAEPDWLKTLFTVASETGSHCVGGPRVLDLPQTELSSLGPAFRACLGEIPAYNEPRRCFSKALPAGGNLLIKSTVFDSVGLFDTGMLMGGCDRDLLVRARAAGFNIWWAPKTAVVRHLIPPYRLKPDYIKWYSLEVGASFAYIDWKRWGRGKILLACMARVGKALLVEFPLLILGYIRRSQAQVLDHKFNLCRQASYTRKTLSLVAPVVFPQKAFFERLEFRNR